MRLTLMRTLVGTIKPEGEGEKKEDEIGPRGFTAQ